MLIIELLRITHINNQSYCDSRNTMVVQELHSSGAKSPSRMQIKFLMSGTVRLVPLKFNNASKETSVARLSLIVAVG